MKSFRVLTTRDYKGLTVEEEHAIDARTAAEAEATAVRVASMGAGASIPEAVAGETFVLDEGVED